MDRRKAPQRKGSYKNKRTGTLLPLWILIAVLGIGGIGTAAYYYLPKLDFASVASKPNASKDKVDTVQSSAAVEAILSDMTLEEKIYQMLFVTPESITGVGQVIVAGDTTKEAIARQPVGGIVYFTPNLMSREQTEDMLSMTQSYSKIPLFLGVDEEGGRVSRIADNPDMETERLAPMREIGDTGDVEEAYKVGTTLAKTLGDLGFNVDFAPVADVLIDSGNTEIGDRSFGRDAERVAQMVPEVVSGLKSGGIGAVLKHFPGHGSTLTDSHTGYSESLRTYDQLKEMEFLPFSTGIAAGADFVMVSHMTLVNAVEEGVPASLSKEVISGWLIGELGFKGIVITDAFAMGAIADNYSQAEAAILAVNAGADMILMPTDVQGVVNALVNAVNGGEISEKRINASVTKILNCKEKLGILK